MPIAYLYQWPAVAATALTVNGGADGLITIGNTDGFYVGQTVVLAGTAKASLPCVVLEVASQTTLYVGATGNLDNVLRYRANAIDASTYTTAATSTISAAQQNKKGLPTPNQINVAEHAAEPVDAKRMIQVDGYGQQLYTPNTLQTLRASAILTNAFVASSSLNISKSNYAQFMIQLTKGSLTNAIVVFDVSDDNATWFPAQMETNGATTASTDYAQTQVLQSAMVMIPNGASQNYMFSSTQLGNWMRARILGTGTLTSSLAVIQAYAGVS